MNARKWLAKVPGFRGLDLRSPIRSVRTSGPSNRSRLSVQTLEEREVPAVFVVTATNPALGMTLDQAVAASNAAPGLNEIDFNIPVTDPGYDPARRVFVISNANPPIPPITAP
jgi:hypothetical protein